MHYHKPTIEETVDLAAKLGATGDATIVSIRKIALPE